MEVALGKTSPGSLEKLTLMTNPCMLHGKPSVDDLGMESGKSPVDDIGAESSADHVNDQGTSLNLIVSEKADSSVVTLEPFLGPVFIPKGDETILYVDSLPLHMSFKSINADFKSYGSIKEIRLSLDQSYRSWEAYIIYSNHKEAMGAYSESAQVKKLSCFLVSEVPPNLDVFLSICSTTKGKATYF